MPSDAVLHQAAALCPTYPDDDLIARLPPLREAAPQLRGFTDQRPSPRPGSRPPTTSGSSTPGTGTACT